MIRIPFLPHLPPSLSYRDGLENRAAGYGSVRCAGSLVKGAVCAIVAAAILVGSVGFADAAARQRRAAHPQPACPRAGVQAVTVAHVQDGDTFIASDRREIDLAGVLATASGSERTTRAQTDAARTALQAALAGPVTLAVADTPDRYGRIKAQVFVGETWLQARLLSQGLVRAAPDLAGAPCAFALVAIENRAREARAGHWGDGTFAVRSPEGSVGATGTFQIVEGRVQSAAVVRSRVYLNFGADWRRDFTATIAPEDKRNFHMRVDWKALQGKRVRVRGWLESYNGPMISLHAPGQIEFLEGVPKPQRRPRKPRKPRAPRSRAAH